MRFGLQNCSADLSLAQLILPMDSLSTMNSDLQSLLQLSRAQTNQFSRSKLPQLLSEYKDVTRLTQNDPRINEGAHLQHDLETTTITNNRVVLPKCARLLPKLPDNKGGKTNQVILFGISALGAYNGQTLNSSMLQPKQAIQGPSSNRYRQSCRRPLKI